MFKIAFKELRKQKELTQQEIAEDLKVSASLIKQWERGNCTPSPETLEQIADYFGTDINTLLGFSTEKEICFRLDFKNLDLAKFQKLSKDDREFVANQFNALVYRLSTPSGK